MSLGNDSITQLKTVSRLLTVVYSVLLSLLFLIAVISAKYDIPVVRFTGDPTSILHGHPFTGVLSNIGVLLWCSTSAVCFFASWVHSKKENTSVARFLLFSGLLTSVVLLDDLFVLHEYQIPKYLHISQPLVMLGYFAIFLTYLIKMRSVIFQTEYIILFIAFAFFALSILCDQLLPNEGIEFLFEDGFKLFGIVTWFIFFIRTCLAKTQQILDS